MLEDGLPVEVRLAREAMATRFELVLRADAADGAAHPFGHAPGRANVWLRAAGEQALDAVDELERLLSFYRPSSALSALNRQAGAGPVPVHGLLLEILGECARLHAATNGAFDPSVGPLMKMWGLTGGSFREPDAAEFDLIRSCCGFDRVRPDPKTCTVELASDGMALDLGGIGKGFAVDEIGRQLAEAGVEHALIHGGTSTISALGRDEGRPWRIGIPDPVDLAKPLITSIDLHNQSLSVSTPYGKGHTSGGRYIGHVLDPRTGYPVAGCDMAVVRTAGALDADALSAALLVLGESASTLPLFDSPDMDWLTMTTRADGSRAFHGRGIPIDPPNS